MTGDRRRRALLAGLGLLLLAPLGGVVCYADLFAPVAPENRVRERLAVEPRPDDARRAVLVSVDGLAPRLLDAETSPVLARLAREGRSARRAETVVPSRTLPSHTSMLSSLPPEDHGVLWNRYEPWRSIEVTTVFDVCRERRLRCGLFVGKAKLAHLAEDEPGVERFTLRHRAAEVLDAARTYAARRDPDLLVVHLAEVDRAGHREGWGSPAQRDALARLDAQLGAFLAALESTGSGRLAVLVTADHGGHGTHHGSDRSEDVGIPWILWGEGIPSGSLDGTVSTLDTAPTLLALLGLEAPAHWEGRVRGTPLPHGGSP